MNAIFAELRRRAGPFRSVLGFTFRSWRRHARWAWASALAMMLSTITELLVPVYAGKLIDAVAAEGDRQHHHAQRHQGGISASWPSSA